MRAEPSAQVETEVLFMNKQLRKYLGKQMEIDFDLPNITPFEFKTQKVVERREGRSATSFSQVNETENTIKFSVNDLLLQGWTGRRFFKVKNDQKARSRRSQGASDSFDSKETQKTGRGKNLLLEICIKPRLYRGESC